MRKLSMIHYPLSIIAAVLLLFSCHRRPLELLLVDTCAIPVTIDWESKARLTPGEDTEDLYRASVWFFAKDGTVFADGSTYKEFRLDDPAGGEVELPVGRYAVLVFNNSVDEFSSNVGFRGTDRYDTFEYYVCNASASRFAGNNPVLEPDILAAWRLDDYEVTREMVIQHHQLEVPLTAEEAAKAEEDLKRLLNLVPERLTYEVHTIAHVEYVRSARSAQAVLHGMAHTVRLASRQVSATPSSFTFAMNNRRFDDEDSPHGTVEARYRTLGLLADGGAPYRVDLSFTLTEAYEGSTTYPTPPAPPFRFDVAGQVRQPVYDDEETDIRIRLGLGLYADDEIILPNLVPGAFSPSVDDWGEEFPIDIPIIK